MNLILYGFQRSGKTYFGKKLSGLLQMTFIDTDHLIEAAYKKQFHESLSCRQIVQEKGQPFFEQLENNVVKTLLPIENSLISLGGKTILDPSNFSLLKDLGVLIYLKLAKQEVKKRILSSPLPTYIDPVDPENSFEQMYAARCPLYDLKAHRIVDMTEKNESDIIEILKTIWSHGK